MPFGSFQRVLKLRLQTKRILRGTPKHYRERQVVKIAIATTSNLSPCQGRAEPTHSSSSAASEGQVLEITHQNGRTVVALGEAGGVERACSTFSHSPENDFQLNHPRRYYFNLLHAPYRINIITSFKAISQITLSDEEMKSK